MNEDPFEAYIKEGEPDKAKKGMRGILQSVCRLWMGLNTA